MNLRIQKVCKSVVWQLAAVLVLGLVFACEPQTPPLPSENQTGQEGTSSSSECSLPVSLKAASAIEFFCTGNVAAVQETLDNTAGENGVLESLRQILHSWEQMQQRRQMLRDKVWQQQQERLAELQNNLSDLLNAENASVQLPPEDSEAPS